ncbi:MAG: CvpA family protein [Oscillospiraceae bacterium]|nr:CvpA family protein [Oscillospiraceae bacterium]
MHILADLFIVLILGFCIWQGYRRGIIGSILAVIFIIVAVYGANLLANLYSDEFTTMFRPFVSGYLDGVEAEVVEEFAPAGLAGLSTEDVFRVAPEIEPVIAEHIFTAMGIHENRIHILVDQYLDARDAGETVNRAMTEVIVTAFCFLIVFIIAFLLLLIALTVIYNIIPFSFKIPGLRLVDDIAGGVLGLAQGLLLVFMLTWFLGYLGLLIPEGLIEQTWLVETFTARNPMMGFIDLYP